jgi:hypothetical protein
MRPGKRLKWGALAVLLAWAGTVLAAGWAARESVPLTRVYAGLTCADPAKEAGIRVADTPSQADRLWDLCRGRLVLGGSAGSGPPVDLSASRLIYLHMGVRRTGGFRLDLSGESAHLLDKTLVIPVVWEAPAKGAMVPQALTHPCLLVAVPRGGYAYERIEAVDETGRTRLSEELPAIGP